MVLAKSDYLRIIVKMEERIAFNRMSMFRNDQTFSKLGFGKIKKMFEKIKEETFTT